MITLNASQIAALESLVRGRQVKPVPHRSAVKAAKRARRWVAFERSTREGLRYSRSVGHRSAVFG